MIGALLFLAVVATLGFTIIYALWGDRFEATWNDWFDDWPPPRPVPPPRSNVTVRRRPYDWARDPDIAS